MEGLTQSRLIENLQRADESLKGLDIIEDNEAIKNLIITYLKKKWLFYCDGEDPNLGLYVWKDGVWKRTAEAVILNELAMIFDKHRKKIQKEFVLDYFKGDGQNTAVAKKPDTLIAFANGCLDLADGEFKKNDSKFFIVNIIPHRYEADAQCEKWKAFLNEVHRMEDIDFIQEWWGYHLITSYPEAAFTIFAGDGQNGKSVELAVMSAILGEDNITNVTMQDINENDFAPAQLFQKLANISDDLPSNAIRSTGTLKNASGGGWIEAHRKHGQFFKFRNYAKITYSCNQLPNIHDDTDSVWDRMKVVTFPYHFTKNPSKPNEKLARDRKEIESKLMAEAPGIINWMVEGLRRLVKNNFKFSYNKSTEDVRKYYRMKADPVVSFIEELIEVAGDDDVVHKEDMWQGFVKWCEHYKLKPVSRTWFFKRMKSEGIESVQSKLYDMKRVYMGYRLRTLPINSNYQSVVGNKVTSCETSIVSEKEIIEERGNSASCYPVISDHSTVVDDRTTGSNPPPLSTNLGKCDTCGEQAELSEIADKYDPRGTILRVCEKCLHPEGSLN